LLAYAVEGCLVFGTRIAKPIECCQVRTVSHSATTIRRREPAALIVIVVELAGHPDHIGRVYVASRQNGLPLGLLDNP
jgi:hypothetical protein